MTWGINNVWNTAFIDREERVLSPRNYIRASELGQAPIEVWLRARAVEPTNLPDSRAQRKMEAGNVVEGIVKSILVRGGVLRGEQVDVNTVSPNGTEVHGRLDFIAGGKVDVEGATQFAETLEIISEPLKRAGLASVKYLAEHYPDGLPEQLFELKSVGTYGMDSLEIAGVPLRRHKLQFLHYLLGMHQKSGVLSYVCRDDYRMLEFEVIADAESTQMYYEAVDELGAAIAQKEMPPKAPAIKFDTDAGKFTKNLDVEWSYYLTKVYGYETPREFSEQYSRKATSWNNVLKRLRDGAKVTDKNLEYMKEMLEMGYDANALAPLYKPGQTNDEEEA